jgi:hypothetical protein
VTLKEATEIIARQREEILSLRAETFDLCAEVERLRMQLIAMEDVVRMTAKLRERA